MAKVYTVAFEIFAYGKSARQLSSRAKRALSKYVSKCSISVSRIGKRWHKCEIRGALGDVDACHMLLNKDVLPGLHEPTRFSPEWNKACGASSIVS